MTVKEMTREQLKAKLDGGEEVVVVETLGPNYYEEGKQNWIEAGLPTESGASKVAN